MTPLGSGGFKDDAFDKGEEAVLLVSKGGEVEKIQAYLSMGKDDRLWDRNPVKLTLEGKKAPSRHK